MTQHSTSWLWVTNEGLVKTGRNSSTSTCSDGSIGHMGILLSWGLATPILGGIPCLVSPASVVLSPLLLAIARRKSANVQVDFRFCSSTAVITPRIAAAPLASPLRMYSR